MWGEETNVLYHFHHQKRGNGYSQTTGLYYTEWEVNSPNHYCYQWNVTNLFNQKSKP